MGCRWHRLVLPARRVWVGLSSRILRSPKTGDGLVRLHYDIQTCGYQDVQVMWEMLKRSSSEFEYHHVGVRPKQPFWRIFLWCTRTDSPATPETSSSSSYLDQQTHLKSLPTILTYSVNKKKIGDNHKGKEGKLV